MIPERKINLLLVEDNEGDVFIAKKALMKSGRDYQVTVAFDGEMALEILHATFYDQEETFDIILLDINLPKKDGFEVLEAIKKDERLKVVPVLMLTGSDAQKDINRSYGLHANGYLVKPKGMANYLKALKTIEDYWFGLVCSP